MVERLFQVKVSFNCWLLVHAKTITVTIRNCPMSIFVGRQKNQMWAVVMFKKFDFHLSQVFTIYSFIFWPKKENRKSGWAGVKLFDSASERNHFKENLNCPTIKPTTVRPQYGRRLHYRRLFKMLNTWFDNAVYSLFAKRG